MSADPSQATGPVNYNGGIYIIDPWGYTRHIPTMETYNALFGDFQTGSVSSITDMGTPIDNGVLIQSGDQIFFCYDVPNLPSGKRGYCHLIPNPDTLDKYCFNRGTFFTDEQDGFLLANYEFSRNWASDAKPIQVDPSLAIGPYKMGSGLYIIDPWGYMRYIPTMDTYRALFGDFEPNTDAIIAPMGEPLVNGVLLRLANGWTYFCYDVAGLTDGKRGYSHYIPHPYLMMGYCFNRGVVKDDGDGFSLSDYKPHEKHWEWEPGVVPSNKKLANVQAVFDAVNPSGYRLYYKSPNPTGEIELAQSHFKGIAYYANRLIFTHTNLLAPPDFHAQAGPIDLTYTSEGVLPQNGKILIGPRMMTEGNNQGEIYRIFDTTSNPVWGHPCSSQACGSYMAMGIQATADSKYSEIQIYDIRPTLFYQPADLIDGLTIYRPNSAVNGVAMAQLPSGKYLIAATQGSQLDVYLSDSQDLRQQGCAFHKLTTVNSPEHFPESGAGIALVIEAGSNDIYLFALNDNGGDHMALFRLDVKETDNTVHWWPVVERKNMGLATESDSIINMDKELSFSVVGHPVVATLIAKGVGDTSFRWGKGLAITSEHTIEIYATDRNVMPLTASHKNFALGVWTNQ